jgi:hypothetical protein
VSEILPEKLSGIVQWRYDRIDEIKLPRIAVQQTGFISLLSRVGKIS